MFLGFQLRGVAVDRASQTQAPSKRARSCCSSSPKAKPRDHFLMCETPDRIRAQDFAKQVFLKKGAPYMYQSTSLLCELLSESAGS